jgi:hypothetical protein
VPTRTSACPRPRWEKAGIERISWVQSIGAYVPYQGKGHKAWRSGGRLSSGVAGPAGAPSEPAAGRHVSAPFVDAHKMRAICDSALHHCDNCEFVRLTLISHPPSHNSPDGLMAVHSRPILLPFTMVPFEEPKS